MPYYRGIEKNALIDSVERARAYLSKLDLGPVTKKALDVLLGPERTGIIGLADTSHELNYAVNETKVGLTAAMFARVLRFHALTDPPPAPGKKSEALDVYTRLAALGAFPPRQFQVMSTIDKEFDAHLLTAYANAVTDEDEETASDAQQRLQEYINDIRQKLARQEGHENIAKWLEELIPLVISLNKVGAGAEVRDVLQGNAAGAALVPAALEAMLNLEQRLEDMHIETPIRTYRVSLGKFPQDEDEREALYGPVLQEIQDLMHPFVRRDEMLTTMVVFADPKNGEGGIMIFGTHEAMEYLAEHLPEDMPLYDSSGQQVLPPSDGPSPQRGSSPSPGPF